MLHASELTIKHGTKKPIISGAAGGKRVYCSSQALPIYKKLVNLAKNGNYWAGLIVRNIEGLSTGLLNKSNIYIEEKASLAYGNGAFHLVLPGVMASLEKLANDSYILQNIKADKNYVKLQEKSMRPGLWRIDGSMQRQPELQVNGMILNKEFRPVVISDMASDDARKIALDVREDLIGMNGTVRRMVETSGFDMHHTPGENGIVGLKKAEKALSTAKERDILKSAILLANTMYKARDIEGVLWYSDWGGAGVLTRAMEILHQEKNISLSKHAVYLNRPTTKSKYALELGEKLGLKPDDTGKKTGANYKEIIGNIIYSDVSKTGAVKTTGVGVSLASAAYGILGASLSVSGMVGVVGAMFFVGSAVSYSSGNLPGKKYN